MESSREPSNRWYSSISNSTMWDLVNDKKGWGAKIDLTFPWTITEVVLSVASNCRYAHIMSFSQRSFSLGRTNIYLFLEPSFLMQITHWRKNRYNIQGSLVKSVTTRPWIASTNVTYISESTLKLRRLCRVENNHWITHYAGTTLVRF